MSTTCFFFFFFFFFFGRVPVVVDAKFSALNDFQFFDRFKVIFDVSGYKNRINL